MTGETAAPRNLLVGTRASNLARTQAGTVRDALTDVLRGMFADAAGEAELHFVHTPGDASQKAQTPVNRIGVGVFTETLRNALAAGSATLQYIPSRTCPPHRTTGSSWSSRPVSTLGRCS